jgi:hypothetical protein
LHGLISNFRVIESLLQLFDLPLVDLRQVRVEAHSMERGRIDACRASVGSSFSGIHDPWLAAAGVARITGHGGSYQTPPRAIQG